MDVVEKCVEAVRRVARNSAICSPAGFDMMAMEIAKSCIQAYRESSEVRGLIEAAKECAASLEAEVEAHYGIYKDRQRSQHRYFREIQTVHDLRNALTAFTNGESK